MSKLKPCVETQIKMDTAFSILGILADSEPIPKSVLAHGSGSVYRIAAKAIDFMTEKKLLKSKTVNAGETTMTELICITDKGRRTLERWCT